MRTVEIARPANMHALAARRGALFAVCMMTAFGALWASTEAPQIVDLRALGRAAFNQVRDVVCAPAQAATPFVTRTRFNASLTGVAP